MRLDDTWATTPGKTLERRHCRQRLCNIFGGGQSIYHPQHTVANAWEAFCLAKQSWFCPLGLAPTWGNHVPAMLGDQGDTQASLSTATQSTSRKAPGGSCKGFTSPGVHVSSQVPFCSLVFSIPAITRMMKLRGWVWAEMSSNGKKNESPPFHGAGGARSLCAHEPHPYSPTALILCTTLILCTLAHFFTNCVHNKCKLLSP